MAETSDVSTFETDFTQTMDAALWAEAFCERFGVIDAEGVRRDDARGLMIGWFANAIMRGYDDGYEKGQREALAEASAAVT